MKGRALRRALSTSDAHRLGPNPPPLLTDTTELIGPDLAHKYLEANSCNRPVNWERVEQYADLMTRGLWKTHGQGILFDTNGRLLTGQNRLWAIIYSGVSLYVRVGRGNPPEVASLLDRGMPQSARDLASRTTHRRHSPVEASLARAICAADGVLKPSPDMLAGIISARSSQMADAITRTRGMTKTRSVLMVMAAMLKAERLSLDTWSHVGQLSVRLDERLAPTAAERCWGRGTAFTLAMKEAAQIVGGAT